MTTRKQIDSSVLTLLNDKDWLYNKIVNEHYSSSRLAKELGTTRTTVEKYRKLHDIEQPLSPKELTTLNYANKQQSDKQAILDKRKATNVEKYGKENTFQSHRDKIERVMVEKYGVTSPLKSAEIYDKRTHTMIEKYGVPHAMLNPDIYKAHQQYFIDVYGVNPGKTSQSKKKAKSTNLARYGKVHINQSHLSDETIERLNSADWLVNQHHTNQKTLTQIASEIGCDITTVYRYCVKHEVEIKYYFESAQQRAITEYVNSLNISTLSNVRNIIKGELDIYIPTHNLAIEYCGVFWHSDAHDRMTRTYHLDKLKQCQELGIRLLTIYEDEWVHRQDIVKAKLSNILGMQQSVRVHGRKCTVCPVEDKADFFDAHHIQGDGPGSITYGLYNDGAPVAMMTFINNGNNTFTLNRYATSTRVVGGFNKLLNHFKKHHEWVQIVSFADLRWSEGGVYEKCGFTLDKVLPPDYRYVIGNKTYHKFAFRRNRLPIFLDDFNPELSEVDNMRRAGYYRIWNCGLLKYVLNNN